MLHAVLAKSVDFQTCGFGNLRLRVILSLVGCALSSAPFGSHVREVLGLRPEEKVADFAASTNVALMTDVEPERDGTMMSHPCGSVGGNPLTTIGHLAISPLAGRGSRPQSTTIDIGLSRLALYGAHKAAMSVFSRIGKTSPAVGAYVEGFSWGHPDKLYRSLEYV